MIDAPQASGPASLLRQALSDTLAGVRSTLERRHPRPVAREVGVVRAVAKGTARIEGLSSVQSDEIVLTPRGVAALVFNLDPHEVGVILLGDEALVEAGDEVRGTGLPLRVPVGEGLLGRVLDPLGAPIDGGPPLRALRERPLEATAPGIMKRGPVVVPLQTGFKVIDALIPIGRGQRQLLIGDRQTGKTSIAVDTIAHQKGRGVVCIYCAIGQRSASVARVMEDLRLRDAMEYTILVVASGDDPPGVQYIAPYAATSMGEYFMEQGRDVLIVYDDLTKHARAYRELSLLLRRPPGREGYPGDIFYIHARLLERSTRLRDAFGGGSLTALPIVETQAGNLSAYIPTNLISITDGQVYLSPDQAHKGMWPAVDVGRSVSRVGGAAQLPAYRAVVRDLRLSYAQFQELEIFSRFATQLDAATRQALERGRRVREVLKQSESAPLEVVEQIAVLLAATEGAFDAVSLAAMDDAQQAVLSAVREHLPDLARRIEEGAELEPDERYRLRDVCVRSTEFLEGPARAQEPEP